MKFIILGGIFQAVLIVLFALLTDYGDHAIPPHRRAGVALNESASKLAVNDIAVYYPMFQDIHVMIFFAFPFLLSFFKRFSYSGVVYAFFAASLSAQWSIITSGVFSQLIKGHAHIQLNIQAITSADYTAAVVLIAYCTTMGYSSRNQLLVISFFLPIFYAVNEMVLFQYLKVSDAGGSILVHAFGAYFGMGFCRMMYRKDATHNSKAEPSYNSDMFSMAGCLFLWIYWPSFNGVFGAPDYEAQHRIVLNTYLGLCSATVVVFLLSALVNKERKITMAHVQNAVLAGGVAVGTAADMMLYPWGALLVGAIGGAISTLGFQFLSPLLTKYVKIHDVSGIHNVHGMPGVLGAIAGAVVAAHAEPEAYGYEGLYNIFSARAPVLNSTDYIMLKEMNVKFSPGDGRTARVQAGYQCVAMVTGVGLAIVGGLVTGLVARLRIFDPPRKHQLYDDADFFDLPEGKEAYSTMEYIMGSLGLAPQEDEKSDKHEEEELVKDK